MRRLLLALGALMAAVLLAAGGAYLYLTSAAGSERVRATVHREVNEALRGRLEAERVELSATRVVLTGVTLRDPEGELVAELERVEAALDLSASSPSDLRVRELKVFRPRLYLRQDERGLNLARALESRSPARASKGRFKLRLDALELEEGSVDFIRGAGEGAERYTAERLTASGEARYDSAGPGLEAQLALEGAATRPLAGPLALHAEVDWEAALAGTARLELAGGKLEARVTGAPPDELAVALERVELPPELVRAVAPSYPLRAAVLAQGSAGLSGGRATFELTGSAASSKLLTRGSFDLEKKAGEATLTARGLNLRELLGEEAVDSDLSLELRVEGGGASLETLSGTLAADIPEAKLGTSRQPASARLRARASDGRLTVSELRVVVPGLQVTGAGSATAERLRLSGKLAARDLAAAARTFGALGAEGLPAMSGDGVLELDLDGPLRHPGLRAQGSFPALRVGDLEARSLLLSGVVPDVRRALEAQGKLEARRVRLGERAFQDVRLSLASKGRELEVELSTRGLANIVVRAGGTLDARGEAVDLASLELEYPEARWTLAAPARVGFAGGDVALDEVELRSGAQRLKLSLATQGKRVSGALEVGGLDLRLLPSAFVPPSLKLAGAIDASVRAEGRLPRPAVKGRVDFREVGVRELRGLGGTLEVAYERDRAKGTFHSQSPLAKVRARFDLPVEALRSRRKEPVELSLEVDEVDLRELARASGAGLELGGAGRLSALVEGTADAPRLTLTAAGRQLVVPLGRGTVELTSVDLGVKSDAEGRLSARLDAAGLGGASWLAVETPLTLARLSSGRLDERALRATPVRVELQVRELELDGLARAGLVREALGGRLSMQLDAQGTLNEPAGTVDLEVRGGRIRAMPAADVAARLVATRSSIRLDAAARRGGEAILSLEATLGAPLEGVLDRSALAKAPLSIEASAGPLSLAELELHQPEEDASKRLNGVLRARLSGSGSLAAPSLGFEGTLEDVALGELALGRARLEYRYRDANSSLSGEALSPSGGALRVAGDMELDLSYGALQKGPKLERAPFQASLRADRFDLRFLSGIHPRVRLLQGLLHADAFARGDLRAPELSGKLEWTDGRVGVLGFGEYRKVNVKLSASREAIELKEASAHAGSGAVRLTGVARRLADGYALEANGSASRFPVIYDDQLVGIASLRANLTGRTGPDLVEIRELAIPEATVELPSIKHKDLQDLDRPADIVLVKDGEPLDKRRRRKKEAAEGQVAAAPSAPSQSPPKSRRYRVELSAPRNLWVRGADVNVELGLSEGFRLEYDESAALFGEVRVLRGRADVIGRKFEIQRDAQIRFQGLASQPYVNLTATHANEREGVTVHVAITGRGKDLVIKPSSQPPLSESEIYTLLATGRRTLKRGSGAAMTGAQAASVLGAYAAVQLKNALAKKLPIDVDVFSIEAGAEGLAGMKVEAGKYVSDKLYIGYTAQVGADRSKGENAHAGKVEYQIGPRWSLEASFGDAYSGGADLVWSRDY